MPVLDSILYNLMYHREMEQQDQETELPSLFPYDMMDDDDNEIDPPHSLQRSARDVMVTLTNLLFVACFGYLSYVQF